MRMAMPQILANLMIYYYLSLLRLCFSLQNYVISFIFSPTVKSTDLMLNMSGIMVAFSSYSVYYNKGKGR